MKWIEISTLRLTTIFGTKLWQFHRFSFWKSRPKFHVTRIRLEKVFDKQKLPVLGWPDFPRYAHFREHSEEQINKKRRKEKHLKLLSELGFKFWRVQLCSNSSHYNQYEKSYSENPSFGFCTQYIKNRYFSTLLHIKYVHKIPIYR